MMRSPKRGTSIEFLIVMSFWDVAQSEARQSSGHRCNTPSSGGASVKMRGDVAERCAR